MDNGLIVPYRGRSLVPMGGPGGLARASCWQQTSKPVARQDWQIRPGQA